MSMLFLPCTECGRALVARTRVDRDSVLCRLCTKTILDPPEPRSHAARLAAYSRRMELVVDLCRDADVDMSKANAEIVDKILAET